MVQPSPESKPQTDALGQPDPNIQEPNPTDQSSRNLQTVAVVRLAVTAKGGQPR